MSIQFHAFFTFYYSFQIEKLLSYTLRSSSNLYSHVKVLSVGWNKLLCIYRKERKQKQESATNQMKFSRKIDC